MPANRKASPPSSQSSATIGFEAKLWLTADKLRNNMDAADWSGALESLPKESPQGERGGANQCKHVVLGLIFLKYISDTFEQHRAKLLSGQGDYAGANWRLNPAIPKVARATIRNFRAVRFSTRRTINP